MTQNPYDQMTEVILAALDLTMSRYYLERNPGDPGAEPSVELAEENLFEKCKILIEEQPEEKECQGFVTSEDVETEDLMVDGKKIGEIKVGGFPAGWKRLSERYPTVPQFPYGEEPHFRTEHYMGQEVPPRLRDEKIMPVPPEVWKPEDLEKITFVDEPVEVTRIKEALATPPEVGDDSFGGQV